MKTLWGDRRRWWLVTGCVVGLLLCGAAHSDVPRVHPPQRVDVSGQTVSLTFLEGEGRATRIEASCVIPRAVPVVWRVLTDYEHLNEFVPFVRSSHVVRTEPRGLLLRQNGRAGFLVLHRDFSVTFRVKEAPMSEIQFDAVAGDFQRFKGYWHLKPQAGWTFVSHEVEVKPAFFVPRWVMRFVQRHILLESIDAVMHRCLAVKPASPS